MLESRTVEDTKTLLITVVAIKRVTCNATVWLQSAAVPDR